METGTVWLTATLTVSQTLSKSSAQTHGRLTQKTLTSSVTARLGTSTSSANLLHVGPAGLSHDSHHLQSKTLPTFTQSVAFYNAHVTLYLVLGNVQPQFPCYLRTVNEVGGVNEAVQAPIVSLAHAPSHVLSQ